MSSTIETDRAGVERDPVTDLPDRHALARAFAPCLQQAAAARTRVAFARVDLDRFKSINEAWGYRAGDGVLRAVASRLAATLGRADVLARMAGDEFALLLHDVDDDVRLSARLHALELLQPLSVEMQGGPRIEVGFRVGVAMYPDDGVDARMLMRRADAALRLLPRDRTKRPRCWARWSEFVRGHRSDDESTPEPFGAQAAALLGQLMRHFEDLSVSLVEQLVAEVEADAEASRSLQRLGEDERACLRSEVAASLRLVLEPGLSRESLIGQARSSGRTYALGGVSTRLLVRGFGHCLAALQRVVADARFDPRGCQQCLQLLAERLHLQLQAYVDSAHDLREVFQEFSTMLDRQSQCTRDWTAYVSSTLARLARLPGVRAVTLSAPNERGEFVVAAAAGTESFDAAMLRRYGELRRPALGPGSARAAHPSARAWRQERLCTIVSHAHADMAPWRDAACDAGVRSVACVPIRDAAERMTMVLSLHGALPGMFESPASQAFVRRVGELVSSTWQRLHAIGCSRTVSLPERRRWRDLLFEDRVEIHLQPIVDLKTARPYAVEALARLPLGDGRLVMPCEFLEHFGTSELSRLFTAVLRRSLHALNVLDADGHALRVSVNMPPEVLQQPECHGWVCEALEAYGIEPCRLQLELLETSEFRDALRRDAAMRELTALGVEMVMDDLGSGYSSLLRLRTLPFQSVKIDRDLVKEIDREPGRAIECIGALVHMARNLGLRVVAEGLESRELVEVATILGADAGQGYCLARPMSLSRVAQWIEGFVWPPAQPALDSPALRTARAWRLRRAQAGEAARSVVEPGRDRRVPPDA